MVTSQLLDFDIQEGRSLIERLDEAGLSPSVAFWLHDPEAEKWRLVLAYEEYDELGPFPVYQKVLAHAEPDSDISLYGITATGLEDESVKLVRAQFAGHHVAVARPRHSMIRGRDVIVYRA